jgi:hypothetical protein
MSTEGDFMEDIVYQMFTQKIGEIYFTYHVVFFHLFT